MKDIHIGAHINTRSLVFTNPIAKFITQYASSITENTVETLTVWHDHYHYQSFQSNCGAACKSSPRKG